MGAAIAVQGFGANIIAKLKRINNMKKGRNGFTLIELLVVIAVIGVLIALLLPVISSSRKNASKARCTNNLSQIKRMLDAYVAENSGKMPILSNWKALLDTERNGKSEIFQCPSTDSNPSYSINESVTGMPGADVYLSQVDNTSTTIFVCDGIASSVSIRDGRKEKIENTIEDENKKLKIPTDNARTRHLGGANYLTLDGNIKYWVPPASGNASVTSQGLKWTREPK